MKNFSLKELSMDEMAKVEGSKNQNLCVTGAVNDVATGFCLIGSFLNPYVEAACVGYGLWQYFAC